MEKIRIKLFGVILLLLGLCSCSDKLDIPRHGSMDFETYYNTDEEAKSAVAAIYLKVRDMEFHYKLMKNLFSDDFWAGGAFRNDNIDLESMNEFTFDTNNSYIESLFIQYYNVVYRANVVLTYVEPDSDIKRQMLAEARVFRAWAYFELTTLWGNPPLVDHPLNSSEYEQPNASPEKLWDFIEKDLNDAINSECLLSKKNVNDKCYRITREYAYALLGKAHLWQKEYDNAAKAFDKVIDSGLYKLYDGDYEDILTTKTANNCESIFESNRVNDPENVYDNYNYYWLMMNWRMDHFSSCPPSYGLYATGYGYCPPRKSLYDAFVSVEGPEGYRLKQSIKTYNELASDGAILNSNLYSEGYFNWKIRYEASDCPGSGWGCSLNTLRWMRYAEVLLCAAEAHYRSGDTANKVKTYMDLIRNRARVAVKESYTLLDIKIEKRLELFGECVRFQDLLRWDDDNDGTGASAMLANQGKEYPLMKTNGSVTYNQSNTEGSYGFKTKHKLLPYPYKEISQNSNINQNPGWE